MNISQLQEEYNALAHKIALKHKRNLVLGETDKYMLCDYPITPENLEIVKTYRQQLRDFTNNDYIFPDKPSFVITMN
jgi:hypothetical protein